MSARAGFQCHVFERASAAFCSSGSRMASGSGTRPVTLRDHAGIRAPSHLRRQARGVEFHGVVVVRAGIGGERLPVLDGLLKFLAARHEWPAFQVCKRGLVRRDHARARAAFDGHIANRHAAFHRKPANRFAAILEDVSVAAGDSDFADDRENDVLRRHAVRTLAVDLRLASSSI